MGTPLGERCGYSVRFEDKTGQETIVKYVTDGVSECYVMTERKYYVPRVEAHHFSTTICLKVLLREAMSDALLTRYKYYFSSAVCVPYI